MDPTQRHDVEISLARPEYVERAAQGDRDAFDVLVAGTLDGLYAVARLILRDADLAEDAVQDALVKAWRELPRLRDPYSFDAWLHRLLVNAATDHYRRRRRFRASVTVLSRESAQHDFAADIANDDELRRGFERLRLEHRTVLVLRHFLDLAPAEIAEILSVPVGTVKSRIHYATEAIRAELEAEARRVDSQEASR